MLTIDKTKVDEIIDGLLGNNDLTASPEVWYGLHQIKKLQPEPQEGHWIKHESPDGGEQYECSECGVLWEFTEGTPEDNEAYFCPKCGAKMKGEQK